MKPGDSTPAEPSQSERRAFTDEVVERLRESGFALVGICDAVASDHAPEFRQWLDDGRHGEMAWLAEHVAERLDPRVLVPGARSVICVADRYHDGRRAMLDSENASDRRGLVARYARGGDYHAIIRSRLEPLAREWRTRHTPHRFRICVDTAPILEREHAMRAGLGRIGKHTLLIAEGLGSWLSLGEIVTTFPLMPLLAQPRAASPDPCGSCTRCIDACPTGAITAWSVDASRCLSYSTIEHSGEVDPRLEATPGRWLYGCDDCQEVCPHNQPTRRSRRAGVGAGYEPRIDPLDLLEVLGWSEAHHRAAATTAILRRATRSMWRRNAVILLGAHLGRHPRDETVRRRLAAITSDESEDSVVRETARRALARADSSP
ncbi:MAG: tRNA epoxyqueuosine(34) reductase QueG [Phycisphaeraceae bacterium]|nr:tRNA epoxyqueuosine(34) reductase QueG [Phycisphaeraceae bacterium]